MGLPGQLVSSTNKAGRYRGRISTSSLHKYEHTWARGPANTCASARAPPAPKNHVGFLSIQRELSLKQTTHTPNNAAAVSVFLTLKSPACPALAQLTAGKWKALEAMPLILSNNLNSNTPGPSRRNSNFHLKLKHPKSISLQEDNGCVKTWVGVTDLLGVCWSQIYLMPLVPGDVCLPKTSPVESQELLTAKMCWSSLQPSS